MSVFAEAFNPLGNSGLSIQTIAPTPVDPLVALAENKDWTGRPIAREDFDRLKPTPGHTRARDTASQFGVLVSKALNWATGGSAHTPGIFSPTPDQIDFLLGQATGGLGREAMKVEQTASSLYSGDDLPTYKVPVFGRFYGDSEQPSSQASAYYRFIRTMNEHEAELKGRRAAGEEVAGYLAEHPEARLVQAANASERRIRLMRRRRRELIAEDADRDAIRAIEERMNAEMVRVNEVMREARR
jgi:hypothetical protein